MDLELCTADFSLLPAHIITQILCLLKLNDFKHASTVCKSWYYASTDPQIVRNLILKPTQENFAQICNSNRRYGILHLKCLAFDKLDSHYFELFEKFCPFVYELHINQSDLKIHHLLKVLELTTCLEVYSFSECNQLTKLTGLFPLDFDCEAKSRIVKNLSGVKKIVIAYFNSIPFIADLLRCAINLNTFANEFFDFDEHNGNLYGQYFTIFDNNNSCGNLRHLNLEFSVTGYADEFITSFIKIKTLNLRSFRIVLWWNWEDGIYKSFLFEQFILKLRSLEEFYIDGLRENQLSLICRHLVNLRSLDCRLRDNNQSIAELANLNRLEKLRIHCWEDMNINCAEINDFFKCKFEFLRIFNFDEIVVESNLVHLCEKHPNLIELKLSRLGTKNLEIIFKHLTKLRFATLHFDDTCAKDLDGEYEYKISRLQDLEEFYLDELVNGIRYDDVKQLTKLRLTNLPKLFDKQLV